MPELPDIVVYIEALEKRILHQRLNRLRIASPFLLRTVNPPLASAEGKTIVELRRLGKRICIGLRDEKVSGEQEKADLWLVLHLMIAGRLHWKKRDAKLSPPRGLAAFDFANGTLLWTEAGSKKRASLHLVAGKVAGGVAEEATGEVAGEVSGETGLAALDPGGLEVLDADLENFTRVLTSANHTLKRALTDPRLFSGIGNAYSDEILFEARLSPLASTQKLKREEIERLFTATRASLISWTERLRQQAGGEFPENVTAFRPEMAVHGRYKEPCRRCGAKIQRIRYAANETNYCPNCQTGGKLLADRALSRLLREDWPKSPEEMEMMVRERK